MILRNKIIDGHGKLDTFVLLSFVVIDLSSPNRWSFFSVVSSSALQFFATILLWYGGNYTSKQLESLTRNIVMPMKTKMLLNSIVDLRPSAVIPNFRIARRKKGFGCFDADR